MTAMPGRRSRAAHVIAIAGVLVALAAWIAWPMVTSAALLLDLTGTSPTVRAWMPVARAAVVTESLEATTRHGAIAARRYRPASGGGPPILIFPGIHGGGVDEPRLVAMATKLAAAGGDIVTVPLPDLRAYLITERSVDMIEDAIAWAAATYGGPRGRVGVVGVSFAGGLALVAAGRPGVADRMHGLFALGAHADLPRVMAYLCGDGAPASLPPPHDYGVVLMLRASLGVVVPPDQREGLDGAIVSFLDGSSFDATDRPRAQRLFAAARAAEATLPEPARTLLRAVNNRDVPALARVLAPHSEQIGGAPSLSPARSPATTAPVYLLHGDRDSVIPAGEADALAAYLRAAGNIHVQVLRTPLITHADAAPAGAGDTWRLIRFWARMWKGITE
jgi:dienelactone hydrolase